MCAIIIVRIENVFVAFNIEWSETLLKPSTTIKKIQNLPIIKLQHGCMVIPFAYRFGIKNNICGADENTRDFRLWILV